MQLFVSYLVNKTSHVERGGKRTKKKNMKIVFWKFPIQWMTSPTLMAYGLDACKRRSLHIVVGQKDTRNKFQFKSISIKNSFCSPKTGIRLTLEKSVAIWCWCNSKTSNFTWFKRGKEHSHLKIFHSYFISWQCL